MGQKVSPIGIRLGITRDSNSCWFPNGDTFANILNDDICIRNDIRKKFSTSAAISNILIKRTGKNTKIIIFTAKPGIIIGKKGEDVDRLRMALNSKYKGIINIAIEEIRKPDLEAELVAESIAVQLEKRVMFRRAMKRAISNAMRQGAKGIKVSVSGRLGGAEIARKEWYKEGRIPLHTFKANIDYSVKEAKTTHGIIGVKVWIFKPDFIKSKNNDCDKLIG